MSGNGLSRRGLLLGAGALGGLALPAGAVGRSERMTITKVELRRVVVPMQEGVINSLRFTPDLLTEFPKGPKIIVLLRTDSGITGIGETFRAIPDDANWNTTLPKSAAQLAAAQRNAEYLRGKSLLNLDLARLDLPDQGTRQAFEIACYDAIGKAFGWPVHRLLGGLAQERVLVHYWCGRQEAADAARTAQRLVSLGFSGLKMKASWGDPIVEAVRAVALAAPKVRVTVDFNSGYPRDPGPSAEEFLPVGQALDEIGNMQTIEDPLPVNDLIGFRQLSKKLNTPITLTATTPREIVDAARVDACRYINTGASGSLRNFGLNAATAAGAGMPVWHGSGHELGVLDAAYLHNCAAAPNCTLPSDILSHQRVHSLLAVPIRFENGHAVVPRGPGLGVELDLDALERFAI